MPILGVVFKKNKFSHKLCITLTSFCYLARMQINYLASYEVLYDIKILKLYQYLYMHSLYKSTWKEWQGNISIRDEVRLRGLKSLARIFFPLLARKSSGFARILPDFFMPENCYLKYSRGVAAPPPPQPYGPYAYAEKEWVIYDNNYYNNSYKALNKQV